MYFSRNRNQTRFVVLPPAKLEVPNVFRNVLTDSRRHDDLFAAMQRFRGGIYKADSAISAAELTPDGRHEVPIDAQSWHVLSVDQQGKVVACLRYLDESYAAGFQHLWVKHAAIANCPKLGRKFRGAVEECMRRTHRRGMGFGEVGGWAVAEEHRGTLEPLRIILATYGLLELLGGCSGLATATVRHSSAMILRRIGLTSMSAWGEEMPPYFDPNYQCEMQVLQFDSREPAEKYRDWVRELAGTLKTAPVIQRESFADPVADVWRGFEMPALTGLVPAVQ